MPSPQLRARILDAVQREPVTPRRTWKWRTNGALVLGLGAAVAMLVALGGPYVGRRPVGYVIAVSIAWIGIAAWTTWVAVARGGSMLGRTIGVRTAVAVLGP